MNGGANQSRTGLTGFAIRGITALLSRLTGPAIPGDTDPTGAGNEIRTRDLNLGKVALYQLSYSRILLFFKTCVLLFSEARIV